VTTLARKRVLITGAAGYLSRQLLPVFRERYEWAHRGLSAAKIDARSSRH
jgi:hypothetical protein